MKKLIIVLAGLALLLMATPAFAAVHTGFDTDSSGCAACHITHAAQAKKLLLSGTNQTEFCMVCHGSAPGASPFDVMNGVALDATKFDTGTGVATWDDAALVWPSYSGGFNTSYNFDAKGDGAITALINIPADNAVVAYGAGNEFNPATSAHSVEGFGDWTIGKIPGSASAVGNNLFTCSSCHDPHSTNALAAAGTINNKRLLRHDIGGRTDVDVNMTLDAVKNRTATYTDGTINKWCGGCHEMLDVGTDAGWSLGTDSRYRHAMNVAVDTTDVNTSLADGVPLSGATKLLCVTCHRAHGTASPMSASIAWTGQDYNNADPAAAANHAGTGSALLRLQNRDVCYECHKAAAQNKNAVGAARGAATY